MDHRTWPQGTHTIRAHSTPDPSDPTNPESPPPERIPEPDDVPAPARAPVKEPDAPDPPIKGA
jgi:hypothetical protein